MTIAVNLAGLFSSSGSGTGVDAAYVAERLESYATEEALEQIQRSVPTAQELATLQELAAGRTITAMTRQADQSIRVEYSSGDPDIIPFGGLKLKTIESDAEATDPDAADPTVMLAIYKDNIF